MSRKVPPEALPADATPSAPPEALPADATPSAPPAEDDVIELQIVVNTKALRVPDLKFLARARRGEIGDEESVDFLERAIVGGVADIPYEALGQVWQAVYAAVYNGPRQKN